MIGSDSFLEIDSCLRAKSGQLIAGDVFLTEQLSNEGRMIAVLADGLGSGVKASVMATLTATMALRFTASSMDLLEAAEVIMDTLPVCTERGGSYSTFTVVEMAANGQTRIIEHGNPPFLLLRPQGQAEIATREVRPARWPDRVIRFSTFQTQREDRIVFFSDGISQAGMGEFRTPAGWGTKAVEEFIRARIQQQATLSARELARSLLARAEEIDGLAAKDDTTCAVVYFRTPRQLTVFTGPPFNRSGDAELARIATSTPGRKVICGGTTANILARQLNRRILADPVSARSPLIPPAARMEGFALITEGNLTLHEVLRLLEEDSAPEDLESNAAVRLAGMLLDSDIVHFVVGTRINEAHQDPHAAIELDLRRNIVRRIAQLLETRHRKRIQIQHL